jgi:hypothetical protein
MDLALRRMQDIDRIISFADHSSKVFTRTGFHGVFCPTPRPKPSRGNHPETVLLPSLERKLSNEARLRDRWF